MKLYKVMFEQSESSQGNWSGSVEPDVVVAAEGEADAEEKARAVIQDLANKGRRYVEQVELKYVREVTHVGILDWHEQD